MSDSVILLDNVHKSFGKNHVLRGVHLAVERGQTFALLGRNGAGKTTLIRALLGLIHRDSGAISVLGRDPAQEALAVRARVGFLAEDQQMFGWMTIAELLAFMAPFYRTWDRTLAERFVREFELPPTARLKHLSKGQTVRLGLLLALAHRPQVVILDDPALGLDPIMRKEFNRDLITHLQGEGATVLYSSHLLYEVEPIADAVAILKDGVIVKLAATEALRRDVKQLVFRTEDFSPQRANLKLLDVRRERDEVAATIENAAEAVEKLTAAAIPFRVLDLNLDDIFAAYVIGRTDVPDLMPSANQAPVLA